MTSRWSNPVNNNIIRDLQGNVLASGSLQFYEKGTTTPLAVYSDSALSSSLGSYINADAYGLIQDFHMALGTEYKVACYDAAGGAGGGGNLEWTRDEVFSLDSNVDTRLDSIESTVNALTGATRNLVINSSCQGAVKGGDGAIVAAPTISSSFQVGQVAGVYVKATNVSAGTVARGTTTDITSGYYVHASGVTTTDAGSTVVAQFRVYAGDTGPLVNGSGVFTCWVYHDVGSAKTFTVTLKKADSEDTFTSLTTIQADAGTSVNSATWTKLTFAHSAFGDCRNGIAIEVSCACGVQTTKNYYFTMPQLETGLVATSWTQYPTPNSVAGIRFDSSKYPKGYASAASKETDLISIAADTDHDITIAVCGARDSSDTVDINLTSAITKQIDTGAGTGWAAGSGASGFPSAINSGSPQNNTKYNVFLIMKADGTTDAGFDSSATAANLLADATGYTYYAKVGEINTNGSANIGNIRQLGQKVYVGEFQGDGAATSNFKPTNWVYTYNATGDVTITHSLNTTNYVITGMLPTPGGATTNVITFQNKGANSIDVTTEGAAGSNTNVVTMFQVTLV